VNNAEIIFENVNILNRDIQVRFQRLRFRSFRVICSHLILNSFLHLHRSISTCCSKYPANGNVFHIAWTKFRCVIPRFSTSRFTYLPHWRIITTVYQDTSQPFEHCSHNSLRSFANSSLQLVDDALTLLSSTSFELDDQDQENHDSLDSWVHHLLTEVDHVRACLSFLFPCFFRCCSLLFFLTAPFSAKAFFLCPLFFFFWFPLEFDWWPSFFLFFSFAVRSELTDLSLYSTPSLTSFSFFFRPAPACSEAVACHVLLPCLSECFRRISCASDWGTDYCWNPPERRASSFIFFALFPFVAYHSNHLTFCVPIIRAFYFPSLLTQFSSSRGAGYPSQRTPFYAVGGSSARAVCSQNRFPPFNFIPWGPLSWVVRSRVADRNDAEYGKPIWSSRLLEWPARATVRDWDQTSFEFARWFSRCWRERTRSIAGS